MTDASVCVVTGEKAPDLTEDGRAVAAALRDRGFSVDPAVWSDPGVEWGAFDVALVRSCWDYHTDPAAFGEWLSTLSAGGVTALNPIPALRWNRHKFYLRDLGEAGVPVLPTAFVEADADADLEATLRGRGWDEAVVKPAVGTSSAGVWRTSRESASGEQAQFERTLSAGDALVQAFAPEVHDGERSLVFFEGEFAYGKTVHPEPGEFRTHPDYGGTVAFHDPPEDVVAGAREALVTGADLAGVDPRDLPYARVDGIVRDGEFRLMELELIEPYLGLEAAGTVEGFADAVASAVRRRGLAARR